MSFDLMHNWTYILSSIVYPLIVLASPVICFTTADGGVVITMTDAFQSLHTPLIVHMVHTYGASVNRYTTYAHFLYEFSFCTCLL